jgi:cell division protein FtsB
MNQAITRHNDFYAISRRRGARRQSGATTRYLRKCLVILFSLLVVVLGHQYLHTQITVTKSQIATSQKITQDLNNRDRFLAQEIESLRHPQRIEQLASAMGMVPPREIRKEKFFNVQYASISRPVSVSLSTPQSKETNRVKEGFGNLVAKLVTYYQRAEAKPIK